MFGNLKEKMFKKVADVLLPAIKTDVIALLGEDAREKDVEVLNKYFDGPAAASAKTALENAGVL